MHCLFYPSIIILGASFFLLKFLLCQISEILTSFYDWSSWSSWQMWGYKQLTVGGRVNVIYIVYIQFKLRRHAITTPHPIYVQETYCVLSGQWSVAMFSYASYVRTIKLSSLWDSLSFYDMSNGKDGNHIIIHQKSSKKRQ